MDELLCHRAETFTNFLKKLLKAQEKMKLVADSKRKDVAFNVGDQVMVRLHPSRQSMVTGIRGAHSKLAKKFYGPFEIMERIGPVAYKLRLPEGARIHLVFHCSLLKPFRRAPDKDA